MRIGTLAAVVAVVAVTAHPPQTADKPGETSSFTQLAEAPEKIYSNDTNDSWNRIFYYLFSRRVRARLSGEFPEAAPFDRVTDMDFMHLEESTRIFEQTETGDRAIDPLYPSFLVDDGVRVALSDPAFAGFLKALEDGLKETAVRSPIARAMMQNDLWAAYDIVSRYQHYEQQGEGKLARRRLEVLNLLGRWIQKVALTPEEIRTLPDNYAIARVKYGLPDLFGNAGWVEVKWYPERLHDRSVDFRRVTRVFLKPARRPKDMQKFLNDFREDTNPVAEKLEGVALVIQPLLVSTHGQAEPANIVIDLQFRMFQEARGRTGEKTKIGVYEVNRRLLRETASGFLAQEGEDAPAYFPAAGNDYSYASPNEINRGVPLVVKQKTRCARCHGEDLTDLMTFAMIVPSNKPPVRRLNSAEHEAAEFVMSKKMERHDWKSLVEYFRK
jgi:hypothetical protein